MATRTQVRNLDGQGSPVSGLDERMHDEAVRRYRGPQSDGHWDECARAVARRFGVDEDLPAPARCMAIVRAMGGVPAMSMKRPNERYMHQLLDAVESGRPERWRRHPVSQAEIDAARRLTGRTGPQFVVERTPGEDDE